MQYEFRYGADFLLIKLSGMALANERLLIRRSLMLHLKTITGRTAYLNDLLSPANILGYILKE